MKKLKRLSSVIIALAVCAMLVVTTWAASEIFVNYTGSIEDSKLCVNELDEPKIVTMSVTADQVITMDAFHAQVTVPSGWTLLHITNEDLGVDIDFKDTENESINVENGMIIWFDVNAMGVSTNLLGDVTFEVPAGTTAGDYPVDFKIVEMSRDWGTPWEQNKVITTELTVGEHADGDNDHNCDYCGAKTDCFDADNDGDHLCDYNCGATVTTCGDSGKDHTCDTDSACTVYSTGANAHVDGEDNDHLCDYGCGQIADDGCHDATDDGDHKCDECENPDALSVCGDGDTNHICDSDSICDVYSTGDNAHKDGADVNNKCEYCGGDVACDVCTELTPMDAKVATCTEDGYKAYWKCICGKYYDEEKTEITDLDAWMKGEGRVVDPDNHTYTNGECVCGAKEPVSNINVVSKGVNNYTVDGSVVTVTHTAACKVGYLVDGAYTAITAVANADGSYSFTAPEGVTEVLLVMKGDVSGDGKLSAKDRTSALKGLLNTSHNQYSPLSEAWQAFAADVTDDGKLSAKDRTLVLKGLLNVNHAKYSPLSW